MRLADFDSLVSRLTQDLPPDFLRGVSEVAVSPKTIPHPTRSEIYTLGECIPEPMADDPSPAGIHSRIVLYHGSFTALARLDPDFDWRAEAWDTLTHELRHHLEWRARSDALEDFDRAAEQNFARHDGEAFDPLFFLDGDPVADRVYQVDDDYFIDRVVRTPPAALSFGWHGKTYRADLPGDLQLPAYLSVSGLTEPPPGELVVVIRRKPSLLDLIRGTPVFEADLAVRPDRP